jgi:ABC-type phosphate/phosphonate transport system substrate-binding protein
MTADATAPSSQPTEYPQTAAARLAKELRSALRQAFVEADAASEQIVLEELLDYADRIERRLDRLTARAIAHPSPLSPLSN